ncbi:restriction endonuclease [Elizabethkingia anophelis]|nr:restriction endonuclease [Elizabethkingia anophelis]
MTEENKSVKNFPNLRFPGFESSWDVQKVQDVCSINPKNESLPNTFVYIDLESVVDGYLQKENTILKKDAPSRAQRILFKNDILFQMVRPYQKNNLFFDKNGDYVASTGYAQIRTNENSTFIFQYLHNQKFVDKVIEKCTGTSYPAINSSDLGKIQITIPKLEEQKKIGDFLNLISQRILSQKKIIEKLETLMKAYREKIFSQKLRFKDNQGNKFPDWDYFQLGEVLTVQGGFAFKSQLFNKGTTKVLRIGDIVKTIQLDNFKGVYSLEVPDNKYLVRKGDFVMALSGATFGKVGKINCNGKAHINQRVATFRTNYCLEFFYQLVQSKDFVNYIYSIPTASAQPNISNSDISKYETAIPSMKEQTKIANFLSSIQDKIETEKQILEKLELQKKFLLANLFV